MNVIRVVNAARASSCDGGDPGEWLPMLGLVFTLRIDGGAMESGDGLVRGVDIVLLRLDWCIEESVALSGEISISSGGDSSVADAIDWGNCFEVAESGEVSLLPTNGTVWRRRRELAGASGGKRAIFEAGSEGLGPQLDIGEKNDGDVGLRKSPAKDERSETRLPSDAALCE